MEVYKNLSEIKKAYERGENIIQLLKRDGDHSSNNIEDILVSYDLQAGSYTANFRKKVDYVKSYASAIEKVITKYAPQFDSIMEAGMGEATTLANVLKSFKTIPGRSFGFDISWSRVKYGNLFLKELGIPNCQTFVGDLFNIPLGDNSVDIVYTSHSIEPNGGREKETLKELYRVASRYLILLEPCYELGSPEAKKRMEDHGYITALQQSIQELGYNVKEFRLFDIYSNPLNPTGLTVISKEDKTSSPAPGPFACPWTKTGLVKLKGAYYSHQSLLAYPVIDDIPCLLKTNAVVATHFA